MSPPPKTLFALRSPLLYRVHEEPAPEKLEALRETAEAAGFTLAKGQVLKTAQLNRLLSRPRAPSMTSSST
jgi:ribonuclease R